MRSQAITSCRVCKESTLEPIHDFGIMASCGFFPDSRDGEVPKGPLKLVFCQNCGLAQLGHNFDMKDLFGSNYGYESRLNQSMVNHLCQLGDAALMHRRDRFMRKILDIGSNDGTFLNYISDITRGSTELFACDPTILNFSSNYEERIHMYPDLFDRDFVVKMRGEGVKFDLITSIAMFYDLPDPNSFVENIYSLLEEDGTWIVEMTTIHTITEGFAFDSICHEHLEYYSLRSLFYLLSNHALFVHKIESNASNGGSLRLFIEKSPSLVHKALVLELEDISELCKSLILVSEKISQQIESLRNFIIRQNGAGRTVHALGASTKGNTLLQAAGIGNDLIPIAYEINPRKFGRYTPGTRIQIVPESELELLVPDFLLVLPWHFRESLEKRMANYIRSGGKLIYPLPEFEVIPNL